MGNGTRKKIAGYINAETAKAVRFTLTETGVSCDTTWLPKSLMADVSVEKDEFGTRWLRATIPAWLYRKMPFNAPGGPIPIATKPW